MHCSKGAGLNIILKWLESSAYLHRSRFVSHGLKSEDEEADIDEGGEEGVDETQVVDEAVNVCWHHVDQRQNELGQNRKI